MLDLMVKAGWERKSFSSEGTEDDKMLTEDLKTKPCWSVCVLFLLNVCARANETYCLSVGAGQQSKCWRGCVCAGCCLNVWLWHQALQHVSIVLHLDFLDQIWDYLCKWFPRACMSTYMQHKHPFKHRHTSQTSAKKGFKTWLNNTLEFIPHFGKFFGPLGAEKRKEKVCLEALINCVYLDKKG